MLFASPLLSLFGADFRAGGVLASAVIAGSICHFFAMPMVHALTIGNVNLIAVINLIWAAVLLAIVWVLAPTYGALTAGVGWFAAHAGSMLLTASLVFGRGGIDRRTLIDVVVVFLLSAAALGGLLVARDWIVWGAAAAACVRAIGWLRSLRAEAQGA